jgi:hypothetical protein
MGEFKSKLPQRNSLLKNTWEEYKTVMNVTDSRKATNVSKRAAFCTAMRNTAVFSLTDIGFVMGKHHATVVHLLKNAEYGYYKNVPEYNEGIDVVQYIISEIDLYPVREEEKSVLENIHVDFRMRTILSSAREELQNTEKSLEAMRMKNRVTKDLLRDIRRNISDIKIQLSLANQKLSPLGWNFIDTKNIESIEKRLISFLD